MDVEFLIFVFVFTNVLNLGSSIPTRMSDPNVSGYLTGGIVDTAQSDVPGMPLSPADFDLAKTITQELNDVPRHEIDPIELAGMHEGDINLTSEDLPMIREGRLIQKTGKKSKRNRAAEINSLKMRWPNGVVPYVISSSYSKNERATIAKAFLEIHIVSCIRFVPRSKEEDYIHILPGDGCFSSIGRKGGQQVVSIGTLCVSVPMIMHELMHALGFWHEQSRSDRDKYITIMWDNIQSGMKKNFDVIDWDSMGIAYDPKSLMHYKPYTFSKNRSVPNGSPTIVSKTDKEMGQRRQIEKSDKDKINKYYHCNQLKTNTTHPITVTGSVPGKCIDIDNVDSCLLWANKGECKNNPAYMQIYCSKSCGVCHDPNSIDPTKCVDKNPLCSAWRDDYQCQVNPGYMNVICKKSCNVC